MISLDPDQRTPAKPRRRAAKGYANGVEPKWCPGCGDFGVLNAVHKALAAIGRAPHEIAFVSGGGCSSRIPEYTSAYGFNSLNGRALPIAQGVKMARPELLVLVAGGDGDCFSAGGGHVCHAIRRNPDLTYLVMDNQVMGQAGGQPSPTAPKGSKAPGSAYGTMGAPVNPVLYALAYGAHFVAQGIASDTDGLSRLIEEAIRFPGFAFINIESPCAAFGTPGMKARAPGSAVRKLEAEGHNPSDRLKAMELAGAYGKILYTGVFYRNPKPPPTLGTLIAKLQRFPAVRDEEAISSA
jgi:2-oxoglutarate ferredoxin oxidoreductase subunit beta